MSMEYKLCDRKASSQNFGKGAAVLLKGVDPFQYEQFEG